jgi:hypothetical protein
MPSPAGWLIPDGARALTVGLVRTTQIVIEGRAGRRRAPGEVLRARHLGRVQVLAGDGRILVRRQLPASPGALGSLVAHLLDEVRAALDAGPPLVLGLVVEAGEASGPPLRAGLAALAAAGRLDGWCEAIDRASLRDQLDRTLWTIDPDPEGREARLDHWDACLDAWDDASDGIAAFLRVHRERASRPATVDRQLAWLAAHRERLRYADLRRRGLCLRAELPSAWRDRVVRPA